MKKRGLAILLAVVMICSFLPIRSFAAMNFTDVPTDAWYYNDVKKAFEGGLINGKSATSFAPDDLLTYAEAVKLAACMHQKYTTGNVTLINGSPWYQTYADYCRFYKIIDKDYAWNSSATRAGYMEIFAKALPEATWKEINEVPAGSIPDVPKDHPQAQAIYKLYRTGIVQGVNDAHFCHPSSAIKRSEVAAILTRMMDPKERLKFSMKPNEPEPTPAALEISRHPRDWEMSAPSEEVRMHVEVFGGEKPYVYEWYMSGKESSSVRPRRVSKTESSGLQHTLYYRVTEEDFKEYGRIFFFCTVKDDRGAEVESKRAEVFPPESFKIDRQPEDYHMTGLYDTVQMTVGVSGGKAPYTFEWWSGTKPQSMQEKLVKAVSMDSQNTLVHKIGEASFAGSKDLYITCIVTDDRGKVVISKSAKVIPYQIFGIIVQPQDMEIMALPGKITAKIEIRGGTAPYMYEWRKGGKEAGKEVMITAMKSTAKESILTYTVSEEDIKTFGTEFYIICVVKDTKGEQVISRQAKVKLIRE